jgi:16S rRNA (guanine527-N7)-methyltransferase
LPLTSNYQLTKLPTHQLASLLRPFITLDEEQLAQTSKYLELLLQWNARINLTAVRDPKNIVIRHFGESFFAAACLLRHGQSLAAIDFGSGAGFPGLPVAMLFPEVRVTLIESSGKKAAFLSEVIRTLHLGNAVVFRGRGEEYPGKADLVLMRAVEKFEATVTVAATLVEAEGRLALMVGEGQVGKAENLVALNWQSPISIPSGHSRILLVGTKVVIVE